ncbi:hypothetical protein D0819_06265 [Bacillus subtilis]|uniref:hypothetical protein n=1 Tax=Bacillus subtilis TaxID=1423 RepID=UPI001293129F|nr:hypothetical protein [Bacillus subtilis]MBU8716552.1 hypothetical protein [Bacillus subtilis]MEA3602967.1 hypothetical protein [Bacillus subtilis]QFY85045.1 hypothetical protein D0819_06265 [Bacillus subtilis]
MNQYIIGLTENCSEQALSELRAIDVEVFGSSEALPHIVYVRSIKSKEELMEFWLIESVSNNYLGSLTV